MTTITIQDKTQEPPQLIHIKQEQLVELPDCSSMTIEQKQKLLDTQGVIFKKREEKDNDDDGINPFDKMKKYLTKLAIRYSFVYQINGLNGVVEVHPFNNNLQEVYASCHGFGYSGNFIPSAQTNDKVQYSDLTDFDRKDLYNWLVEKDCSQFVIKDVLLVQFEEFIKKNDKMDLSDVTISYDKSSIYFSLNKCGIVLHSNFITQTRESNSLIGMSGQKLLWVDDAQKPETILNDKCSLCGYKYDYNCNEKKTESDLKSEEYKNMCIKCVNSKFNVYCIWVALDDFPSPNNSSGSIIFALESHSRDDIYTQTKNGISIENIKPKQQNIKWGYANDIKSGDMFIYNLKMLCGSDLKNDGKLRARFSMNVKIELNHGSYLKHVEKCDENINCNTNNNNNKQIFPQNTQTEINSNNSNNNNDMPGLTSERHVSIFPQTQDNNNNQYVGYKRKNMDGESKDTITSIQSIKKAKISKNTPPNTAPNNYNSNNNNSKSVKQENNNDGLESLDEVDPIELHAKISSIRKKLKKTKQQFDQQYEEQTNELYAYTDEFNRRFDAQKKQTRIEMNLRMEKEDELDQIRNFCKR